MTMTDPADTGASWWIRAEHVAIVIVCGVLGIMHLHEINWSRFIAAFLLIDLVGYLPGAAAFRKAGGKPISPTFHLLYNLTHNYVVAGIALALWAFAIGGLEWAMLAVPIHLSGDRGLLGNFSKPVSLPFEPSHPSEA